MAIGRVKLSDAVIANLEIDGATADLARYQVYENLSKAQLSILNSAKVEFLHKAITKAEIAWAANTALYLLPNGSLYSSAPLFLRFIRLHVDYVNAVSASNQGRIATEYKTAKRIIPFDSIGSTRFPYFNLEFDGLNFYINPTPTDLLASGGWLIYIQRIPDIDSSTDSELDERFENLLVYEATSLSALVDNYRPEISKEFAVKADNERNKFLPTVEK